MNRSFKSALVFSAILAAPAAGAGVLFNESFDDANVGQRGWYDNTRAYISTTEHSPGSAASLQFHFAPGATTPDSGGGMRHLFAATNSVYLRYYVKHSSNWVGSGHSYHPHEFYFITNKDSAYVGPADTHLTAYVEENSGKLSFSIQDTLNIDQSRVGVNLSNVTENRAVAGCNGSTDGYPDSCYAWGGSYRNEKVWRPDQIYFSNSAGPYYKGDWHKIEAYIALNSVVNGKGIPDGVVRYWYDGQLALEHTNLLFRTGAKADMQFNQLVIGPYIGDGSPVDQTFWVDDLQLATERSSSGVSAPKPPTLISVE
jgi:hypothetical protein